MSYRRTKQLLGTTGSPTKKQPAPEDDWGLVANPSIYLDELPQPYKFINNLLQQLIMKPVS